MRQTTGTLDDLTVALNEAIDELSAPITHADGTLASATSQLNALLVWASSPLAPADGTLASAVSQYNTFVVEQEGALVERVCQVYRNQDESLNISLNTFCGFLWSILGAYHTVQQMKDFYNMRSQDENELDIFVARILAYPATSNTNLRERAIHRVEAILNAMELSLGRSPGDSEYIPGYSTVEEIRAQLNSI